jgi:hypothetical protein
VTIFQRRFLYISTIATTISGVLYIGIKTFVEPAEPWALVNHPLEPWALKAHILTAPLMLFSVGLITARHIIRSLKSHLPTGYQSGMIITVLFGPLALTGYVLQTVISPLVTSILSWVHLVLGLICAIALAIHWQVLQGRLIRRPGALPVLQLPSEERGDSRG